MIPPLPYDLSKKRQQADYKDLSRLPLLNHLETEKAKSRPDHKILDFITKRCWTWIYYYLKSRFLPNHSYPAYSGADNGIYTFSSAGSQNMNPVSIAVVADWATNTDESCHIAQKIASHNPDYTIHMGDTYFVGARHEIANNFLTEGSPWVRGKTGSFAILGNHEMYAQGISYFDDLIKTLGIRDVNTGIYGGQQTGFFCLENEYWQIVGLDTGYHSIGKVPIFELIFQPDCHFDDILMKWLKDTLHSKTPGKKKGLLFITHHQYFTAFHGERGYQKPADQLAELIGKDRAVIWLWGHEHKFSAFEKTRFGNGVTAYGRCIGHGGMPIELKGKSFIKSAKAKGSSKLIMADTRQKTGTDDYPLGHNGYALISILNEILKIGYYDEDNLLLEETWKADESGEIKGIEVNVDPSFKKCIEPDKSWEQMIY